MILGSLFCLWMHRTANNNQTDNSKKENSLEADDMTTKPAGIGSAWGTGPAALNSVGVLDTTFVFIFAFIL